MRGGIWYHASVKTNIFSNLVVSLDNSDPYLKRSVVVLPLHSTIPQDDQQKVFSPAADGTKIHQQSDECRI
jgi:HrpA-like RNA helicase